MNAPYAGSVAQRQAHVAHLNALGSFDYALTVKLRRWDRFHLLRTNFDDHKKTAEFYLRRLNSELFGHGATRKGYCIASAVSYENLKDIFKEAWVSCLKEQQTPLKAAYDEFKANWEI